MGEDKKQAWVSLGLWFPENSSRQHQQDLGKLRLAMDLPASCLCSGQASISEPWGMEQQVPEFGTPKPDSSPDFVAY